MKKPTNIDEIDEIIDIEYKSPKKIESEIREIEYKLKKLEDREKPEDKTNPYLNEEALIEKQKQSRKEVIQEANESPDAKEHRIKVMKKSTYILLWIFASLFFVLLTANTIWFNISFLSKDFGTNVSVINNMPEIPVNIDNQINNSYQHTINTPINSTTIINVNDEIADKIANEVIAIIKNQTNSS